MRLAFLSLFATSLLLQQASLARAEAIESRRDYIVNGEPAGQGDIRGTVAVALLSEEQAQEGFAPESLFSGAWCTGVLIAPTVVLTAGHCVEQCISFACTDPDGSPNDDNGCFDCSQGLIPEDRVYIAAGSRTLDDLWLAEVVPVRELFVPEKYLPSPFWNVELAWCEQVRPDQLRCEEPGLPDIHDIAILRLDAPVTVLGPVRLLPSTVDLAGSEGLAIGYGERTSPGSDELLTQDRYLSILHQTATPIERVSDQEILTGAGENHSGVCLGDSGGPLYVRSGNDVFVAGIASRIGGDVDGPDCGGGAIHTLVPAYADWIFEKAPEANRLTLSGGGGCSASSRSSVPSALLGLALFVVLCLLRRRSIEAVHALVIPLSLLAACGSSSAADPSFCTEKYDPRGIYCNPEVETLDLPTAHAFAQAEVPDDAFLFSVRSAVPFGLLDPDGRSESWTFTYYLPGRRELPEAEFLEATVRGAETFVHSGAWEILLCVPTEPIPVLDSRQVIHDAIRMIESSGTAISLGDEGATLLMEQHHVCRAVRTPRNSVKFGDAAVFFNDEGVVLALYDDPST